MPTRARLEKLQRHDGELFVFAGVFVLQPVAAHRAEVALDVHAEHLLELLAQVARNQMQRLLEHRAAFDRVKRLALLEAAMKLFDQRALAGSHRAHEVEDLAALLAFERGGVKDSARFAKRFSRCRKTRRKKNCRALPIRLCRAA